MPKLYCLDMGPCEILWDFGNSGEISLGEYLGQVLLRGETSFEAIEEERHGNAAVDGVFSGTSLTLEAPFTRSTLQQLNVILNAGGVQGTPPSEYLFIVNQAGCDLYDLAKPVCIKPICNDVVSTDPTEWTLIYKAIPLPALNLPFDRSTQRTFPVTFRCFVSHESGYEGTFGQMGLPSGWSV